LNAQRYFNLDFNVFNLDVGIISEVGRALFIC
jgi:hypothetical protein